MADGAGVRNTTHAADAALAASLAVVWRLPALFAPTHLVFDDGVYGSAVLAMRSGAVPFRDVWSPQGPAHLAVLWFVDLLGGRSTWSPRLASVAAGVVAVLAVHAFVARVAGRVPALVAAVLVALTGSIAWVTVPVTGDGPAMAWALVALAASARLVDRPTVRLAVGVGTAAACAVSTKVLVAPVLAVALVLVGSALRSNPALRRPAAAAAIAAGVVTAAWWTVFGFSATWHQSIAYHTSTPRVTSTGANLHTLWSTLVTRDPVVLVALVLGVAVAVRRPPTGPLRTAAGLVGAWAIATALLLVAERAMFRAHVSAVALPLAILATLLLAPVLVPTRRGVAPAVVVGLVVAVVALATAGAHDLLLPRAWTPDERLVVEALRALPPDAVVVSDEPGLAWRSDRRMPPWLDDPGIKRFAQSDFTSGPRGVVRAIGDPMVCAVVVWSYRYATLVPGLHEALDADGYEIVARPGSWRAPDGTSGTRELWQRACRGRIGVSGSAAPGALRGRRSVGAVPRAR